MRRFQRFSIIVRQDKWLLIISFILAFLVWQGIRRNIGFEVSVADVAVDVKVPTGWAVWEKSVPRVNILFRGSREDIRYLNNEQLRVEIPIKEPSQGEVLQVRLDEKYLKNPTGASVVRFSPSDVVVKLDRETEKQLPVKAATSGTLPVGFEIDRIACTPASVLVSGAERVLNDMESIGTEPIELKGRQSSFNESVPIALPQIGRIQVEPDWVSVDFRLVARSSTRELKDVPVRVLSLAGDTRLVAISPDKVDVTVKGPPDKIEQLRLAELCAYVGCVDLKENAGYDLPVSVDLPMGLQLVKTAPSVVHVELNGGKQAIKP